MRCGSPLLSIKTLLTVRGKDKSHVAWRAEAKSLLGSAGTSVSVTIRLGVWSTSYDFSATCNDSIVSGVDIVAT